MDEAAKEGRTKYRVHKTNLKDDDGNKVLAGEIVELGPKLAKHYNKLGFLRPVIDDEDEDDEPEAPTPARSRRINSGGAQSA